MTWRRVLTTAVVFFGILPTAAWAGTDSSITSRADQVRWGGVVSGNTGVLALPQACGAHACDERGITLRVPRGTYGTRGGVQVSIRWSDESQDLDLYVYAPNGSLAAKSVGLVSTAESVFIKAPQDGVYRALVTPTMAEDVRYEGSAEIEFLADALPKRELLPDLISLKPRHPQFETSAYLVDLPAPSFPNGCYPEEMVEQGARRCLRFDQTIANVGDGPFEVRYRLDGAASESTRDLVQRVYSSDGSVRDRFADTYTFHPAHAHFHYVNFARSHLWKATTDGKRAGTAPIRSSRKNGFCMVDVEQHDFGKRGDAARTYIPPGCLAPTVVDPETGELSAISGISKGWADVYTWYLADQYIEVSGVPDGVYILENVADQAGTVKELDDDNNSASGLIRICGSKAEIVGGTKNC